MPILVARRGAVASCVRLAAFAPPAMIARRMRTLTAADVDAYRRDGFLVLPGFVPAERCAALRAHALALAERLVADCPSPTVFTADGTAKHAADAWFLGSGDSMRCFYEQAAFGVDGALRGPAHLSLNKLGHAMHDRDAAFAAFSRTPELAAVAAAIGMRDPRLLQSMYLFKHPGIGGEVNCHVDHTYLWTEPRSVVGFWFAIDDATTANGCMWALPGGHRLSVRERSRLAADRSRTVLDVLDAPPYPTEGFVPLEAPRGTLVLLDGALPHRSGPNRSAMPRHAYTLHAIEGGARYLPDNWLQRDVASLRGFRS